MQLGQAVGDPSGGRMLACAISLFEPSTVKSNRIITIITLSYVLDTQEWSWTSGLMSIIPALRWLRRIVSQEDQCLWRLSEVHVTWGSGFRQGRKCYRHQKKVVPEGMQ